MIQYTTVQNDQDLLGILKLQRENLAQHLTPEQVASQGFVTVAHTIDSLKKMHSIEQSIIARDGDTVVAYILAMTEASRHDIPVLIPMFEIFNEITFQMRPLSSYHYLVVGQACVQKDYRGKGILDQCYATYVEHFREKYDFAVTEIATKNTRSFRAHKRVGFECIHEYVAPDGEAWKIVVMDWKRVSVPTQ